MEREEEILFISEIENALEVLKNGGIIIYPTDTIWGIGCDATKKDAVAKIYELKHRSDSKSMLTLVDSVDSLYKWLRNVPQTAEMLLEVSVTPLTIIYDSPVGLASNLLADDGSIGIRVTGEKFSQTLCRRLRHPLVSTSANISGMPSPRSFHDIDPSILREADYVVNYKRNDLTPHKPSGIIKIRDNETFYIIR